MRADLSKAELLVAVALAAEGEKVVVGMTRAPLVMRIEAMEQAVAECPALVAQRSTGQCLHPSGGSILFAGSDLQVMGKRFSAGVGRLTDTMHARIDPTSMLIRASQRHLLGRAQQKGKGMIGDTMAAGKIVPRRLADPTPGDWDGRWAHEEEQGDG